MNVHHKTGFSTLKIALLAICCQLIFLPFAFGDCIEGDCKNGRGTFTGTDGTKYIGDFKDGKFNGQGTFTEANGNRYVGGVKDGLSHGQGTRTWHDGTKYVGEFKNGKMNGQGTVTWVDGGRYVGEFKDSQANGQGTRTWPDNSRYVGEFKDYSPNGPGIFTWADGVAFDGVFVDGTPQPPYDFLLPDGTKRRGSISKSVRVTAIVEKSQAQAIGLQKGDIVVEYKNDAVLNAPMLLHLVSQTKPEEEINIIVRRQGRDMTFPLKGGRIGIAIQDELAYAVKKQDLKTVAATPAALTETGAATGDKAPVPKPAVYSQAAFGKYYALVIGNNNYKSLPKLKTARSDAQTVAGILRNQYGFTVTLLLDARRSDVLEKLVQFREKLTDRDNLLIYYAGHGYLDKDGDEGYWLPVDATAKNEVNWISNASITTQLKAMEAKHVLIIADSCYSGKLGRSIHIQQRTPDYYSRVAGKRSRTVIASGGLEPVIDSGGKSNHSVFASAFIDALQENDSIMDASGLFNQIRRPVVVNADQNPEFSDIRKAGHDGGEFVFVRKR